MSSNTPENPYGQEPTPPEVPQPYGQQPPVDQPPQPYGQQPPSYGQQPPADQPPQPYGQQPPSYGQQPPSYNPAPQFGAPYGAPAVDPGKTMGIIALILPFVGFSLVGLVLGIIAKIKSKKAGFKNTPALIAIILGIVVTVVSIVLIIVGVVYLINFANEIAEACSNGAESVTIDGQVIPCTATTP